MPSFDAFIEAGSDPDEVTRLLRAQREVRDDGSDTATLDVSTADAHAAAIIYAAAEQLPIGLEMSHGDLALVLALGLAGARQSALMAVRTTDRELQSALPTISHLSLLAESMVAYADRTKLAAREDSTESGKPGLRLV